MSTLCIQVQPNRAPDIDMARVRTLGEGVASNEDLVSRFAVVEGESKRPYLNLMFEATELRNLWHQIERSPLLPAINALSGTQVVPQHEAYVRQLAAYRKAYPSPLGNPDLIRQTMANIEKADPAIAAQFAEGEREWQQAMEEMLEKYGQ